MTLEEAAAFVQRIVDAGKNERGDVLVICHGGPIAEREDVAWILDNTRDVDGFFGASSIERLAAEVAITEQTRRFKSLRPVRNPRGAGRDGGIPIEASQR